VNLIREKHSAETKLWDSPLESNLVEFPEFRRVGVKIGAFVRSERWDRACAEAPWWKSRLPKGAAPLWTNHRRCSRLGSLRCANFARLSHSPFHLSFSLNTKWDSVSSIGVYSPSICFLNESALVSPRPPPPPPPGPRQPLFSRLQFSNRSIFLGLAPVSPLTEGFQFQTFYDWKKRKLCLKYQNVALFDQAHIFNLCFDAIWFFKIIFYSLVISR